MVTLPQIESLVTVKSGPGLQPGMLGACGGNGDLVLVGSPGHGLKPRSTFWRASSFSNQL